MPTSKSQSCFPNRVLPRERPAQSHGMSTGQPWQQAELSLLYFTATISSTCFPAPPGHLALNTINPWHEESLHTPYHRTPALLTKDPKRTGDASITIPAATSNAFFPATRRKKETFLHLCADLGLEPPTSFSGRCLTTGKITLLESDSTFRVDPPPRSFLQKFCP